MKKRDYINITKDLLDSIDIKDEQIDYIIRMYADEDTIVGIHNTFKKDTDVYFKNGIMNTNDIGESVSSLSNTVMYTDMLPTLLAYANGDGEKREKTAIVLKIPKKVFEKEQGIFEKLDNGTIVIPPQYITGALQDGHVIENPQYNKDYIPPEDSIMCDKDDIVRYKNKAENIQYCRQYLQGSIFKRMMNKTLEFFKGRKNKNVKLLGDGRKDVIHTEEHNFRKELNDSFNQKANNKAKTENRERYCRKGPRSRY